jgi:hypothetical protein
MGHPLRSPQLSPYPPYSHGVVLQIVAQFCPLMNCATGIGVVGFRVVRIRPHSGVRMCEYASASFGSSP